jgi:hypothetical protein
VGISPKKEIGGLIGALQNYLEMGILLCFTNKF